MKNKSNLWWWIAIAILILGLAAAVIFAFRTQEEHKKVTEAMQEEKNEIAANLDEMVVKYEDAISQNTSLSTELEVERDRVLMLRDSIKGLKRINYSLIKKYRKQIANLQVLNQRLFRKNDSLRSANESLSIDLEQERKRANQHQSRIDTLTKRNYELEGKVTVGSVLKVSKFTVTPLKRRSSGKLVNTSRARRVDAFRVSFFVQKNSIADKGKHTVSVQIKNQDGEVLGDKKNPITLSTGDKIVSTSSSEFDYQREETEIILLPNIVKGSVKKGFVDITVYIDGHLAGGTTYKMKY